MDDKVEIFPVTALDLRFEQMAWPFERDRRAEIDAHFAKARAERSGIWNGRVLVMWRWTLEGTVFHGVYREVDFASFLMWRDLGFPDHTTFHCFGMAALRGADGGYILGEMAPTTASAGRIYFPAGVLDPGDVADAKVDLAGNVMRELAEETGLTASDVEAGANWTCVRVGQRLAMMRDVRAVEDAQALRARILDHLPHDPHQELADIHIVRGPDDVDPRRMPPWVTAYLRHVWSSSR